MISVVMPAYNASSFIAEAIESILNQTFREFELIIVDDGSSDDTVEIIKHYANSDQRIRLIQAEHGGICHALNIGVEASNYSWIARMDADDISLPQRFEKQMNAVDSNPNVVAWGTYVNHISSKGKILSIQQQGPLTEQEFYELKDAGEIPFVIHPTTLLKKDVLLKIGGYDRQFALAEDLELLSRMTVCGPILAIPEVLLLYRVHLKSSSMQKFFSQQQLVGHIVERHRARLAGNLNPELLHLPKKEQKQLSLVHLREHIHTLGRFFYRKAGLHIAEQQYIIAGINLGAAIIAHPYYSLPRLWKQRLSPKARKALKESRDID